MKTDRKSIYAVLMVAIMLCVPLAVIGDTEQSEATSVAPAGSNYAYKVTVPTTASNISKVEDMLAGAEMTAVGSGTTGSWTWDSSTGVGPFNMFYAAMSLGAADENAISTTAGQIAYILDPFDLSKALRGKNFNGVSTDISGVIGLYNIMLVIPTVYVATATDGDITYLYLTNNTSQPVFSGLSLTFDPYAHTAKSGDVATIYPYLGIGVYEASTNTFGSVSNKLLSQSGATPEVSQNIQTFRGQLPSVDTSYGKYQLWNFYEWTLYKMIAQTMMGSVDVQGSIGSGRTGQSTSGTTGQADAYGPVYADGQVGKVLIENAWGSVWEFVDNIYVASGTLHIGNGLESTLSSSSVGVTGDDSSVSFTPSGTSGTYIATASREAATWDIPLTLTSASTEGGLHDACWYNNSDNRVLIVGGLWYNGAMAGLSYWHSNDGLSCSGGYIGARSAYLMSAAAADVTVTYSAQIEFHEWDATNGGYAAAAQNYTSVSSMSANMVPQPIASDITYGDADYEFAGWLVAASAPSSMLTSGAAYQPGNIYNVGVISTTQDTVINLYAVYSPVTKYNVTYYPNAGGTAILTQSVTSGSFIPISNYPDSDTGFIGWGTAASATSPSYAPGQIVSVTSAMDLYAVFDTAVETVSVTFKTVSTDTGFAVSYVRDAYVQLPVLPDNETGRFVGWSATEQTEGGDVQTLVSQTGYQATAATTLFAQYAALTGKVTATFYDASGNAIASSTIAPGFTTDANGQIKYNEGQVIGLPAFSATSGTTFVGWYTAASDGSLIGVPGDVFALTANTSFYARTATNVSIAFQDEAGTPITGEAITAYAGQVITLPNYVAADDGYVLKGWYDARDAEGHETILGTYGSKYTVEANITFKPLTMQLSSGGSLSTYDVALNANLFEQAEGSTEWTESTDTVADNFTVQFPEHILPGTHGLIKVVPTAASTMVVDHIEIVDNDGDPELVSSAVLVKLDTYRWMIQSVTGNVKIIVCAGESEPGSYGVREFYVSGLIGDTSAKNTGAVVKLIGDDTGLAAGNVGVRGTYVITTEDAQTGAITSRSYGAIGSTQLATVNNGDASWTGTFDVTESYGDNAYIYCIMGYYSGTGFDMETVQVLGPRAA